MNQANILKKPRNMTEVTLRGNFSKNRTFQEIEKK